MKQESEQFKSEPTPVIDLKKVSNKDIWDNEKTEVFLEGEGEGSCAFLRMSDGDYIPISAFPFVIGRGNECDLVLNGKGISRKHAEIVFQSGRFVINDLDSLNGLKVNGYKVARVILEEGDSVKLGEVSLVFTSSKNGNERAQAGDGEKKVDAPAQVAGKARSNKKLVYIGLVAIVATAGALGLLSQLKTNSMIANSSDKVVVARNPNITAKESTVDAEVSAPSIASATTTGGVMAVEKADTSAPPPVDSIAPPPSIAPPTQDVVNDKLVVRKEVVATRKQVTPPERTDRQPDSRPATTRQSSIIPVIVKNETKSSVKSTATPVTAVPKHSVTVNFEEKFRAGDAENALKQMKSAIDSGSMADAASKQRYGSMLSMFNKYVAGRQAFAEGRKSEALNYWSAFLKEEKAVFGSKRSVMAASVSNKLADEYVVLGNEAARQGKHHDAYKFWQKSLTSGDSVAARIAMDSVNQKSKQLYRQALRLEYVNTERAKELWRQVIEMVPPGTEYHTKATSKLAWYEKWGA